jgi:septal ring factor EnvC (AmiA/AmiB activator)
MVLLQFGKDNQVETMGELGTPDSSSSGNSSLLTNGHSSWSDVINEWKSELEDKKCELKNKNMTINQLQDELNKKNEELRETRENYLKAKLDNDNNSQMVSVTHVYSIIN